MAELLSRLGSSKVFGLEKGLTKVNRIVRDLSFSEVLKARLEQEAGVKFSAHAMDRLNERNIVLDNETLGRLSGAVSRAEEKGMKDSLIIVDDRAFIVSIQNRTVVTAMTGDSIRDNIFTNIDSTILA